MRNRSLRQQILIGFLFFTILQFFFMFAIAIYSYHKGEDGALARVVKTNSALLNYQSDALLPSALRERLIAYSPGVYELSGEDDADLSGIELHAFKFQRDNQFHYRLLRLPEQQELTDLIRTYSLLALIALVLVAGFGGWAGHTIAERLSKPMEDLAIKLKSSIEISGSCVYANPDQTAEVAAVASALDDAVSRLQATRARETTLSRNISHELRTPLTVIRTALDTGTSVSTTPSEAALTTARRACEEMELLTSACLELAREQRNSEFNISDIASTVKQIVKESLHLLDGKDVQLDLHLSEQSIELPVSEPLARLVLGNVIRNGFIHCSDGAISIDVEHRCLRMVNTSSVSSAELYPVAKGFGVGLSIMGQTCHRLNWRYEMSESEPSSNQSKLVSLTVYFTNI